MVVNSLLAALKEGNELPSAEAWKNNQQLVNAISAVLASLFTIAGSLGYPVPLTQEQISAIASAVFLVVVLFNLVATAVSSTRAGILPRRKPRGRNGA